MRIQPFRPPTPIVLTGDTRPRAAVPSSFTAGLPPSPSPPLDPSGLWRLPPGAPPAGGPSRPGWWSDLWLHQQEGIEFLQNLRAKGEDRGLVIVPGAGGKTRVLAGYLLTRLGQKPQKQMLVIAHNDEMRRQMIKTLCEMGCPSDAIGGFHPQRRNDRYRIILASAQMLLSHLERLKAYDWDTVGIDEAHHYVEKNLERTEWIDILKELGFYDESGRIRKNPERFLVGMTATPDRLDGIHLRDFYGDYGHVFNVDIEDLIERGHIKPVEVIDVTIRGKEGREITLSDLSETMRGKVLGVLCKGLLKDKTWIGFMADRRLARWAAEATGTLAVTHETPLARRRLQWDLLREGKLLGIFGVHIPIEGLDIPRIDAVLMGVRTYSRARAIQMATRAARVDLSRREEERAPRGIVVDTGGNVTRLLSHIAIRDFWLITVYEDEQDGSLDIRRSRSRISEPGSLQESTGPYRNALSTHHLTGLLSGISRSRLKKAAWKLGITEDEIFAYQRGDRLPNSRAAARELGEALEGEPGNFGVWLQNAWTWDKAEAMEIERAWDPDLSETAKEAARAVRYLLWARYAGAVTEMGRSLGFSQSMESALDGHIDRWFTAGFRNLVCQIGEVLGEFGVQRIDRLIFERKGWAYREGDVSKLSWRERLHFETQKAVSRFYAGDLPQKPEGLPEQRPGSPLFLWIEQKFLPERHTASMGLDDFFRFLEKILTDGGMDQNQAASLIERAIFEARGWNYPDEPTALTADEHFLFQARQAFTKKFGGVFPSKPKGLPEQRKDSPLTLWLDGKKPLDKLIRGQAERLIAGGTAS